MKKTRCIIAIFLLTAIGLGISSGGHSQAYRYRYGYPYRYSYIHPHVAIYFGGYGYGYGRAYFYRPYGSVFQLVVPPIGVRIATLPFGYSRFYLGLNPYYYDDGIFYRPYARGYEVIDPPLGAVVERLPRGSKVKTINGGKYYEYSGTYYQEQLDNKGRVSYKVVGTNGVLNGDGDNERNDSRQPEIGDRIDQLPPDSRTVVINGEQLYSTPGGLYYKKIIEDGKTSYEMVGK